MIACLNPHGGHPALEMAQIYPVCARPDCGFLLSGATIERWQVHTFLRRNPTADLYLATSREETTETEAKTLIKVLHTFVSGSLSQVERLLTLYHLHIHPLLSIGWIGGKGGKIYLISSYEERGSLANLLTNSRSGYSPLTIANMVYQIAEALQHAHERKFVHGRLKPENCLFVSPHTLHICDWHRPLLPENLLSTSSLYDSPESLHGSVEPASDQYSLALIAYDLLSGQARLSSTIVGPFNLRPLAELRFDLPSQIDPIFKRALSQEPRARFPTVLEFAQTLRNALANHISSLSTQEMQPLPVVLSGRNTRASRPLPTQGQLRYPASVNLACLLPGHTSPVTSLRWAYNGLYLASTGAYQEDMYIWRIQRRIGTPLTRLGGYSGNILALCWSPDSESLASTGSDATIRIWNLKTFNDSAPKAVKAWWGHDGGVTALDWSLDGKYIASGGVDRTIRLWSPDGQPLAAWQAHGRGGITALAWSPDSQALASGGNDHSISIWNASTGVRLAICEGQTDEIRYLSWSPRGSFLASFAGKKDLNVRIWDGASGQQVAVLKGHRREIVGLFWSDDGSWLATASIDSTLRFWDIQQDIGKPLGQPLTLPHTPISLAGCIESAQIALGTPDMVLAVFQFDK